MIEQRICSKKLSLHMIMYYQMKVWPANITLAIHVHKSAEFEEKYFTKITRNITSILDGDDLFSYKPAERGKRSIAGRQRWIESYDPKKDTAFVSVIHAAQNSQINTLCTGKQMRVNSYSEECIGNLMHQFL